MPQAFANNEHELAYLRGVELFNQREFWASHEAWEEVWLVVDGVESDFYQGLIQCAAALLKYQRHELEPALRLYHLAKTKLDRCPDTFKRLNVREFQQQMADCFGLALAGGATPIDVARIPTLTLAAGGERRGCD